MLRPRFTLSLTIAAVTGLAACVFSVESAHADVIANGGFESFAHAGGVAMLDNASLTVIPEPASLVLIGLGSLLMVNPSPPKPPIPARLESNFLSVGTRGLPAALRSNCQAIWTPRRTNWSSAPARTIPSKR